VPLLTIDGLRAGYGNLEVIHGVSLTVEAGEFVSLIGANGAGKTTLLRAISGTARLMGGSIALEGSAVSGLPSHRRPRLGIAHVPEGRQVFADLTVRDNLLVGSYTRRDRLARDKQLDRVLTLFPRLRERYGQRGGTLSGGEQQMVAIGRAMMLNPILLMLDEPSQGLARMVTQQVYENLADINSQGTTVLLVEQQVVNALRYSQRVYVMERGLITASGDSEEMRHDDQIRARYLGI
jgi:branched-chain amino acid transport system ATP-binding protein